ncbi:hypothetical protein JANAI62_05600 [Jannaschia pagri]|uniref:Peptidase M10 serralysin C-terminal domain-containing protein n=1 Tax=Jannaschia pagri TaxID=2829797 RepID=A0ABQ4NHM4_9RHOB|nr:MULTISPECIES: calcium-binding protein [unclassified Jannaschia]GIT89956.1 hypothetical protein JANAI61_04140 [Jannaschia sp. AI_61]GIT93937.1 hypothetical protein JANAI62_05600 [Jannaschia sp. AI_62]
MPSFVITTDTTANQVLNTGDIGFIAPSGGIATGVTAGVTITGSDASLAVLGYLAGLGQNAVISGTEDVDISVGKTGSITAQGGLASGIIAILDGTNSSFRLSNEGLIQSFNEEAVTTGFISATSRSEVDISNSGRIIGDNVSLSLAVRFGSISVTNDGWIEGTGGRGITLSEAFGDGTPHTVTNSGTIRGKTEAIQYNASDTTNGVIIVNTGEILSDGTAIKLVNENSNDGGVNLVVNDGLISGPTAAINVAMGTADIVNRGQMNGDVSLTLRSDSLTNTGTILGDVKTFAGADSIKNLGVILGDIETGDGGDTVDVRGGVVRGTIDLGADDDRFITDTADMFVIGGTGQDTIEAWADQRLFDQTTEVLILKGTANSRGAGNGGNDTIFGNAGDNALFGFSGNDSLDGADGNDSVYGSFGSDTLTGGLGANFVHGGADDDFLRSFGHADTMDGGTGDDIIISDLFADGGMLAYGGRGNDDLISGIGADTMDGGVGSDTVSFLGSNDRVVVNIDVNFTSGGTAEGDVISNFENVTGGSGNDLLVGTESGNVLDGSFGDDSLRGEGGQDTLIGGAGADTLNGGDGSDFVSYADSFVRVVLNLGVGFTSGGDAMGDSFISIENAIGSQANDRIVGSAGDNILLGDKGRDALLGGAGADTLNGGDDADQLTGGAGADVFVIDDHFSNWVDTILDFEDGLDKIDLSRGGQRFSDLTIQTSGADLTIDVAFRAYQIVLKNAAATTTLTEADFIFQ